MPSIKILPENLINQIAAGEVVERPASVVKELVENSLDAEASKITVEIEEGGSSLIRVTDNGLGMDREDAVLCLERHATSKIGSAEDLLNIRSLGFRGEAIASIASVSKLKLQTKKKGEIEGTLIEEGVVKSIGCPEGTQMEVRDLFYNTPARKKYLKNVSIEYRHILNTVTAIAMAFPEVAFRLIKHGKVVFDLAPTDDDLVRVRGLLGKNIADEMVPIFYGHSKIKIKGFVGKPSIARSGRGSQYLFVNRRDVKSHSLAFAVQQSFYSLLPKEKKPVFVIYLEIDPALVDVNVHPQKKEVRFVNEKAIFSAVLQSCKRALEKHVLAPSIERVHRMPVIEPEVFKKEFAKISIATPSANAANEMIKFDKPEAPYKERVLTEDIIPLAQIANSYILCEQGESLVIVDQHAAHERIRYTEIVEEFEKKNKSTQRLLMPLQLELSHKEVAVLNDNMEIIEGMGFEIEEFGGNTFSIYAVPSFIVNQDLQKTILGLIDDLMNNAINGDFQARKERSLTYMACRSAVMFGDKLSKEEQESLLKRLQELDLPYTCPHGRPTIISFSLEELARKFGR